MIIPPAPREDADLDLLIQSVVAGVTNLDGTRVRPRWQPVVPQQPEPGTDWCAVGIPTLVSDDGPYIVHNGDAGGSDTYIRHELLEVLVTFYGPHAAGNASLLRDGLAVPQNSEALNSADAAFVSTGQIRAIPELVNRQWIHRFDIDLQVRRKLTRVYGIRNILDASVHLFDDTRHLDRLIEVPPPGQQPPLGI